MIDWVSIVYIFICGAALLLMGLGFGLAAVMPGIDRWSKRFFANFFGVLFLNCCVALIEMIAYVIPGARKVVVITEFLMSLLIVAPLPMLTVFLLHVSGEDWKKSPIFRFVTVLLGLYSMMVLIAQFTSFFYYIAPDKQLRLGPWYPLAIVPPST